MIFYNYYLFFYQAFYSIFILYQFTKIADYLDASGTVYSLRVDGLSENTTKFLEKFRSTNLPNDLKKNDDNGDNNDEEVESVKTNKPKVNMNVIVIIFKKYWPKSLIKYTQIVHGI